MHLFITVRPGNDQQHTAYGTLVNLTYRMPSPDSYSLSQKDQWPQEPYFRPDSCCFNRWVHIYAHPPPTKNPNPKKPLQHNKLPLFRYASIFQHLVVLNRVRNMATSQEARPTENS